ncbi:MAG: sigma-54-dependent Fis family transcriptional regulator [Planctomycetes bacterium]|nr:sigma-54-dependent Fis family transcriptional regulator [Planctomycetota bacterium]
MSSTAFVLIVEDNAAHGEAIAEGLKREGHACKVVSSGAEAIASVGVRPPDVIITDYKLGGPLNGMDVLKQARELSPHTQVILITAFGSEQLVRDALGPENPTPAYDYLIKPIDIDDVREKVNRAAEQAIAARDSKTMREQIEQAFNYEGIIGTSAALAKEIRRIQKLAKSKSTVLIFGESGTGKELVAQALHANSRRSGKAFKVINCAALSESLLESELFGHVKGAFTGAIADKKGILEAADGGTLFLDEIGDMPLSMQAKLLRTLESGEVQRVGSTDTRFVDVRFVAATHRNLREMVDAQTFREDLFYRLHAQGAIRLPPLRQRREDIPILAKHFLEEACRENGIEVNGISTEVMRRLTNQTWRGNVRELRSVIQQMVIEAEGDTLEVEDLPESLRTTTDIVAVGTPSLLGMSMADVERLHILNTLKLTGGNREKAAKILKIGARTLYRKLKDYGVTG